MGDLLSWIENTNLARTVGSSVGITASLSAIHVIGFTLVTSGALLANLRALGALLRARAIADVVRPANNAILTGLAISAPTGALLFAARATEVGSNGIFQLKMLLLVAAAAFHFAMYRRPVVSVPAAAALSLFLWLGLAVTACAFILLE
jgi:hypothetical protein